MQKSGSQKALKVISIFLLVISILGIIAGFLSMAGGGALGISGADVGNEDVATVGVLFLVFGAMAIIGGLIDMVIAIFGIRGANNPQKIGVFFILAIIGVVFGAISLAMQLFSGVADISSILSEVFSLALPIACVVLAYNIKKENNL